jgi:hypothetical protein
VSFFFFSLPVIYKSKVIGRFFFFFAFTRLFFLLFFIVADDVVESLQFVSTATSATTKQFSAIPEPAPTPKYVLEINADAVCNRTHPTNVTTHHSSIPRSRPGRAMMDQLKEIRR